MDYTLLILTNCFQDIQGLQISEEHAARNWGEAGIVVEEESCTMEITGASVALSRTVEEVLLRANLPYEMDGFQKQTLNALATDKKCYFVSKLWIWEVCDSLYCSRNFEN